MKTQNVDSVCPHCGAETNEMSSADDAEVKAGDTVLCVHCGELGRFDEELKVRVVTYEEVIAGEPPEEVERLKKLLTRLREGIENRKAHAKRWS